MKRDAPEIAQAFIEGEYPSAAAAGRAAGIPGLQKKTPLEKAQVAIERLSDAELAELAQWMMDRIGGVS